MQSNSQSQQRAKRNNQQTYQHAVIELWPACVECGTPIRRTATHIPVRLPPIGIYRLCECPGALWWYMGAMNWEKIILESNPVATNGS